MVGKGDIVINKEGGHIVVQVGETWFDLLHILTGEFTRNFHSDDPLNGAKHIVIAANQK